MSDNSNLEIIRFLDCVRGLYPAGLPRTLLEQERKHPPLSSANRPELVAFEIIVDASDLDSATDPYFGVKGELLRGIVTQGLKRKIGEVRITIVNEAIAPKLSNSGTPTIIFGLTNIALDFSDGRTIIRAGSLGEILEDKEAKRRFWNQLKSVVSAK